MEEKSPGPLGRLQGVFHRAQTFIKRDLWLKLPEARGPRLFYRVLRMGVLIVEGFVKTDVFMLSAALTYQVLFALVPLLVVMLAFVKGVGGFAAVGGKVQQFILESILPRMGEASAKGAGSGADIKAQIDAFIQNVNATAVGVVGGIALLYTSLSLLMSIENVLNRIWGIRNPRTILRRLTVYWTFLSLSPILLAASLSMTGVVQSNQLYLWLTTHVPYFGKATLLMTPYVVAWVLFTGFYIFMPNTRVHPGAALIGALISGTAWEGMKTVYFWYNSHVVTNYKFYGSLGTIPVFLLWIYLSWIIVLFGAEVVFAAQHVNTYRREVGQVRLSAADRDRLALVVAIEVVKPFVAGAKPPTGEEVALRLNSPVRVVNEILYELSAQGILRAVTLPDRKDAGYLPAKDPTVTSARDVVAAIRTYGDPGALPSGGAAESIYRLIDRAEAEAMGPLSTVSIR
ncbi:MAG TPA: YhjD/YihY/BrkB family envelope integrity protein, partial [Planctomycetota bacterium]|nr:YhjD/YihY/BrkB family envelope integrity protein [Planctomycetota bacterium]